MAILKLRGSSELRKERRKHEPPAIPGDPVAPPSLSARQREIFDEAVGHMRELGILSQTDGWAIAARAILCDVLERTNAELAKAIKDGKPTARIEGRIQRAVSEFNRANAKLGLSPADRASVRVNEKRVASDPREKFFQGGA